MSSYAELHCHSAFSLLDGAATPETLVRRAAELGIRAVALTDHDDLGGAARFSAAARDVGVEAIIGAELTMAPTVGAARTPSHLTLLARTATGYANLSQLVSRARMGGGQETVDPARRADRSPVWAPQRGRPRVSWDDLAELGAGLFVLTGCSQGELSRRVRLRDGKGARELLDFLRSVCGGYVAVEVWDHALPEERQLADALLELADRVGLPAVATNDVHYANPSGRIVHDVLTCLRHEVTLDEAGTRLKPNGEWYLKPSSTVWRRWRRRPDVVENTLAVARECPFRLTDLSPEMPGFQVPPGLTRQRFLERLGGRLASRRAPGTSQHRAHRPPRAPSYARRPTRLPVPVVIRQRGRRAPAIVAARATAPVRGALRRPPPARIGRGAAEASPTPRPPRRQQPGRVEAGPMRTARTRSGTNPGRTRGRLRRGRMPRPKGVSVAEEAPSILAAQLASGQRARCSPLQTHTSGGARGPRRLLNHPASDASNRRHPRHRSMGSGG